MIFNSLSIIQSDCVILRDHISIILAQTSSVSWRNVWRSWHSLFSRLMKEDCGCNSNNAFDWHSCFINLIGVKDIWLNGFHKSQSWFSVKYVFVLSHFFNIPALEFRSRTQFRLSENTVYGGEDQLVHSWRLMICSAAHGAGKADVFPLSGSDVQYVVFSLTQSWALCSLWFRNMKFGETDLLPFVSLLTVQRQTPGPGAKRPKVQRHELFSVRLLRLLPELFAVGGLCVISSSVSSWCGSVLHAAHFSFSITHLYDPPASVR